LRRFKKRPRAGCAQAASESGPQRLAFWANGSCASLVIGQIVDVDGQVQADKRTVHALLIKISSSNAPAVKVK
jgi:hypothetical protein